MSLAAGEIAQAQRIRKTGQACGVKKASVLELDYEVMREAYIRKNYEVKFRFLKIISKFVKTVKNGQNRFKPKSDF